MPNRFDPAYPVAGLRGAPYNPRRISEDSLEMLRRSIKFVGMAKPVIITDKGLILAGHQRTKALAAIGRETTPVYIIEDLVGADEMSFNQLHNGTDNDEGAYPVTVPASTVEGYAMVPFKQVEGKSGGPGAPIVKETCRLMARYGNWGACVATFSGEVLSGRRYAQACLILGMDVRVFYIPDAKKELTTSYFGQQYGRFSYEHLPRETYVQSFAQPFRLRNGRESISPTYKKLVLPKLQKSERLIDFGCGQADHIKWLQQRGYNARGIEFFHRLGNSIDTREVHEMIDRALADMAENGLYDVVVCDYVVNSVDTKQAERDVWTVVNALCKPGGRIYLTGRSKAMTERDDRAEQATNTRVQEVYFLDDDGFTAYFRKGTWFYQRFHEPEEAKGFARTYLTSKPFRFLDSGSQWRIDCEKDVELPVADVHESLAREFDLPWPKGRRVDRASQAIAAWEAAREASRNLLND